MTENEAGHSRQKEDIGMEQYLHTPLTEEKARKLKAGDYVYRKRWTPGSRCPLI